MARRSARGPNPRLIDPRNRVSLSRAVMRVLDLQPGDYITFVIDEQGGVRLYKLSITVAPPKKDPKHTPTSAAA